MNPPEPIGTRPAIRLQPDSDALLTANSLRYAGDRLSAPKHRESARHMYAALAGILACPANTPVLFLLATIGLVNGTTIDGQRRLVHRLRQRRMRKARQCQVFGA